MIGESEEDFRLLIVDWFRCRRAGWAAPMVVARVCLLASPLLVVGLALYLRGAGPADGDGLAWMSHWLPAVVLVVLNVVFPAAIVLAVSSRVVGEGARPDDSGSCR